MVSAEVNNLTRPNLSDAYFEGLSKYQCVELMECLNLPVLKILLVLNEQGLESGSVYKIHDIITYSGAFSTKLKQQNQPILLDDSYW